MFLHPWLLTGNVQLVSHDSSSVIVVLGPFLPKPISLICKLHSSFFVCSWSKSTKSPALGADNISQPRLISLVGIVREVVCA